MGKQVIVEKDLDELMMSNENPRTGYALDQIDAIHKIIYEQKDKIIALMKSLIEGGWIIGELPGLFFDGKNYIVYEGNRRIASLKCFFNPSLVPLKNKTGEKIKKYISSFSDDEIKELRNKFKRISCVLFEDKKDAYRYMEKRHTPNNGKGDTLERWNTLSNEIFKNDIMKKKSLFGAVYSEYEDLFENKDNFPVTTLTRILNNSEVKRRLEISFNNGILSINDKKKFSGYLKKIINDIENKKVDSRKLAKSVDIESYINSIIGKENDKISNLKNIDDSKSIQSSQNQVKSNLERISIDDNIENKQIQENKFPGNKRTSIKIPRGLIFDLLETKTVDYKEQDNFGILYIANELKNIAKSKDYKRYPSATAMLIRNLLEQSLKYQLKKISEYDNMLVIYRKDAKTNKEPGLEYIINYCLGNIKKVFPNKPKIQKAFRTFAQNQGTKDYFDMIVHNPSIASAEYTILEKISNVGLYRIIFYILNS